MVVGIYRDTKRRGIYPPLWIEPEEYSCFSTYQISWMKINKKEIFVLKTRSLIGVYYVSIDSVRGIIFIILLQTQWEIFFFRPVNRLSSKLLSLFWYLLVQLLRLPLKLHLSKLSRKEMPLWNPFKNSEMPREPIENCYPLIRWILNLHITLLFTHA